MEPQRRDRWLTVRCPLCKAEKGAPCVYMPIKEPPLPWPRSYNPQSPQVLARRSRVGTPTQVPHNDRGRYFEALERLRERRRARPPASRPLDAVLAKHAEQDAEFEQMRTQVSDFARLRAWLRENGGIFL